MGPPEGFQTKFFGTIFCFVVFFLSLAITIVTKTITMLVTGATCTSNLPSIHINWAQLGNDAPRSVVAETHFAHISTGMLNRQTNLNFRDHRQHWIKRCALAVEYILGLINQFSLLVILWVFSCHVTCSHKMETVAVTILVS